MSGRPKLSTPLLAAGLALLSALPSKAIEGDPLYTLDRSATRQTEALSIWGAVRATAIRIDPLAIAANPERFTLELPDGRILEAERDHFTDDDPRWKSWSGSLSLRGASGGASGHVHLVDLGDHATGTFHFGTEQYQIASGPRGSQVLVELAPLAVPVCGLDDVGRSAPGARPLRRDDATAATLAGVARIDVLAMYSQEFIGNATLEQQVREYVVNSIGLANDIFRMSGVDAMYHLVDIIPLSGEQPPAPQLSGQGCLGQNRQVEFRLQRAIDWISNQPDEVKTFRTSYGADVVALFVPLPAGGLPPENCGIAMLPLRNAYGLEVSSGDSKPFSGRAFTVIRVGCGLNDYTVAHEIGHNFGMVHGDSTDPDSLIETFARGYMFPPDAPSQATVLGCVLDGCDLTARVCNRIPHFSDSVWSDTYGQIGDDEHDNSAFARSRVAGYATFLPASSNKVPVVRVSQPARNAALSLATPVSLRGTATDVEDGNLGAQIQWSSSLQGALGSGATLSATLTKVGSQLITARVTDSAGKKALWSVPVTVDGPPVAAFTASCTGFTCTFDASGSLGNQLVDSSGYSWTFGDGSTGSGKLGRRSYASWGSYIVTLTVRDTQNRTASKSILQTISVPCVPSSTILCLQGGRFQASLTFVNGTRQDARAKTYSDEGGFFTFFDAANLEVGVKILDGRATNGSYWLYHGAATSLAYTLTIFDRFYSYSPPIRFEKAASTGTLLCGGASVDALPSLAAAGAPGGFAVEIEGEAESVGQVAKAVCSPGATRLCLLGGRFAVQVRRGGVAQPAADMSDLSGTFWFFGPTNAEVFVKVLDGQIVNGKVWVLFGSLTDLSYEVAVTDSVTGVTKTYTSPAAHCGRSDVNAF